MMEINPGNTKCDAMEGFIKEGESIIQENNESYVRDAALIAAAQRIEHYEIPVMVLPIDTLRL